MFDIVLAKINLIKQKRCLIALLYVLDSENIQIFKTSQGLIECHKSYHNYKHRMDSLEGIKNFYLEDLKKREELTKYRYMDYAEKQKIKSFIVADRLFLNELTDEFIDTYNKIVLNIKVVAKLHNYLDIEHQELLLQFYDLIKNTIYEKGLSRSKKA